MGHRCCSKQKVKRGLWSPEEDEKLVRHITAHGHGCWSSVPKLAGLQRCGKSCRLRWINYLRPDLKRGTFTAEEEQIIIDVHRILGNRWAQIAKHLPGRTDNEVKNFWNSCIKKKLISQGLDPKTHNLMVTNHKKYNNKASPTTHKPTSSSLFTVNSKMTPEISIETNQLEPFTAVPPLPSALHNTTQSPLQPTSEFQNPTTIWAVKDHDFVSFPCDQTPNIKSTPISSSSSCSVNPSAFGFVEDINFMWGSNGGVEVAFEERQQKEHEPQKEKVACEVVEVEKINDLQQKEDMAGPFDSFNFDLEFVESTLMAGAMSRELTSMDDLAWSF